MSQRPFTDFLNVEERGSMDAHTLTVADHLLASGPVFIPFLRLGHLSTPDDPFVSPEITLEPGEYLLHDTGTGGVLLRGREADLPAREPFWFPEYYLAHRDCTTCAPRWDHLEEQVRALRPGDSLYLLHHGERLAIRWPHTIVRSHRGHLICINAT